MTNVLLSDLDIYCGILLANIQKRLQFICYFRLSSDLLRGDYPVAPKRISKR